MSQLEINEEVILPSLIKLGFLSEETLASYQEKAGLSGVISTLLAEEVISDEQVIKAAAEASGVEYFDLSSAAISPEYFDMVPADIAKKYTIIPVQEQYGTLTIAVANPFDFNTIDQIPHLLQREVQIVCSLEADIKRTIQSFYDEIIKDDDSEDNEQIDGEWDEEDGDAPIIKLVNNVLLSAFKVQASDIHIEPTENQVRVRLRVDGKLTTASEYPIKLLNTIVSRVKIMTQTMSIAEKRLPQDGRIQMSVGNKNIDLRVNSIPTSNGESIVMRVLDKSALEIGMNKLGFFSDDEESMGELIGMPDGIILVTGPTGSGKTTTLYSMLHEINKPDRKIITVEDPVEYELQGINQVMVKSSIGMTFPAALRSMLRQAPNIIMIGEIRDEETASIAINASLTGHLVLSTLHTNDAPSAIARLEDIGIKRFLISSSIQGILAQRLVRILCPDCKKPGNITAEQIEKLQISNEFNLDGIMQPVGCQHCRFSGYRGRMGLFEILRINDDIRQLINENVSSGELRQRARELGMKTLREDGVRKIIAGKTSVQDVLFATNSD